MSRSFRPAGIVTGLPAACVRTNCPDRRRAHYHPVGNSAPGTEVSEVVFLDVDVLSPRAATRPAPVGNDLARWSSTGNTALSHPAYEPISAQPEYILQSSSPRQHPTMDRQQLDYQGFPERRSTYAGRNVLDEGERLPSISELIRAPLPRHTSSYYMSPANAAARRSIYETQSGSPPLGEQKPTSPADKERSASDEGPERSFYDFVCAAAPLECKGEENIRKSVSHFFGRNKGCTKNITKDMWVTYCRKHYQRGKYNATKLNCWGLVQHEQLVAQMRKFDETFVCNDWEIKYCSGLKKAVDIFKVNFDLNAEGIDDKWKNMVETAWAVREFIGRGRTNVQVWELIHVMKAVQQRLDLKDNIAVEFLPHNYRLLSEVASSSYTTARPGPPGPCLEPNPRRATGGRSATRTRTNRAALSGTGRHAAQNSSTHRAASPRHTGTYHPDVPVRGIADLALPPLSASRRLAPITTTSRSTRRS